MTDEATHLILLAGCPNSGKSTLFNHLTGGRQKIANYPGVTVEKKSGKTTSPSGHALEVIDLPGMYSLSPLSPDEEIACRMINAPQVNGHQEAIIAVIDATQLDRSLGLVLELAPVGRPLIIALNMMDLANSMGIEIDIDALSQRLGHPVIGISGRRGEGVSELLHKVEETLAESSGDRSGLGGGNSIPSAAALEPEARFRLIDDVVAKVARRRDVVTDADWTKRIDRVVLHPIFGGGILLALLFFMFQAVFAWSEMPMTWIEDGVAAVGAGVGELLFEMGGDSWFRDLMVDGIIAGVGAVLVFLPQIIMLFFFIFLLESSGYMARAALILDRIMALFGLQGRSFVPLLSSFACAIPGIMATRTIKDPKDRLITLLVAPLMTCSARLPVYVLLIGAFIPDRDVGFGLFNLQGVVMFSLFMVGVLSSLVSALALKWLVAKGPKTPLLLELPKYQWPDMRNVLISLWIRVRVFLKRAGTIIMGVAIALWFLSTYPKPGPEDTGPAIHHSYAGKIGRTIQPLVGPLGYDWRIATGLIPGFAAREVMVGALATIFAVEAKGEDGEDDEEALTRTLGHQISAEWSLATGLSLLVWYIFSPQCLATFATMRRETMGWKYPTMAFGYFLALAYGFSWLTYRLASLAL